MEAKDLGRPPTPAAFIPFTPVAQRAAAAPQVEAKDRSTDEEEEDTDDVQAADDGAGPDRPASRLCMPPRDKRMEQVRKSMLSSVKPFHGRTKLDTYTVIDWVEKVDTADCPSVQHPHGRARDRSAWSVVRSGLHGRPGAEAGPTGGWLR